MGPPRTAKAGGAISSQGDPRGPDRVHYRDGGGAMPEGIPGPGEALGRLPGKGLPGD